MSNTKKTLMPRYSWWVGDDRMFVILGLYFQAGEPYQYEILEAGKDTPILRCYQELQDLVAQGVLRRWS